MSSLVYPQLIQFPVQKTKRPRTVVNTAADGSTVRLADPAAEITQWRLDYVDLMDDEAALLEQFFADAEGSLNGFTFLDPTANLLAWSDELDIDVWQTDPLLMVTDLVADPAGGTRAWRLSNPAGAGQGIGQTIEAPGGYSYCFSVYVRAAAPTTVRLTAGGEATDRVVTSAWDRIVFAVTPAAAESVRFGIEVSNGAALDIYGPQVEAQGGASKYRAATRGGVYTDAHLSDDVFSVTRTGCNRNSCTVNITHANHL
jgi:hypothetical protein